MEDAKETMVRVEGLSKHYGSVKALDDVSFEIKRGEIVGFLGPNGAGKTTTMKILTGYIPATKGSAFVAGRDVDGDPVGVKKLIGSLPESAALYPEMNVIDYLEFIGEMRGLAGSRLSGSIDEMVEACSLVKVAGKTAGQLSKGYRQRLGLAAAMIHRPELLVLDEPTSGLDPAQIIEIRNLIREAGSEKTVILCTHILQEVEAVCSQVIIINEGRIVMQKKTSELAGAVYGYDTFNILFSGRLDGFIALVSALPGYKSHISSSEGQNSHRVRISFEKDALKNEDIFRIMADNKWALSEIYREKYSLEDIFLKLTGSGDKEELT